MHKIVILLLITFLAVLLTQAQVKKVANNYSIHASLGNWDSSSVSIVADGETLYADSVQKNGFHFSGHVSGPAEAYFILRTKKATLTLPFYIEPGFIRIEDDSRKEDKMIEFRFRFTGTPHNDLSEKNSHRLDSLFPFTTDRYEDNLRGKTEYIKQYIRANRGSLLTLGLFRQFILNSDINDQDKLTLFNSIDEKVRNTYGGKEITKKVQRLANTSVGVKAPLFSLPDTAKRNIELEEFRGKYVLLDFWASWCVPCRKENPAIRKAYEAFKNSGLVIVSVSLDNDKEKWLEAIRKDQLTWVHVSDLMGWENEVAKQYYIESLPANFLLSPDGVIIAKNISGEALQKELSVALGGKLRSRH